MDINSLKKVGNTKQVISVYDLEIQNGIAKGKRLILANNNALEVAFNADNALDIAWVKYKGVNVSFLSKNGLNNNTGIFSEQFEGGFLYTCGLDNVSACDKSRPIHGSLHARKAENVTTFTDNEKITISADVYTTALKGVNLKLHREYVVTANSLSFNDTVINCGFTDSDYVLLYHVNFGYPFLDKDFVLDFDAISSFPANATTNIEDCKVITDAKPKQGEELYYHYLKDGVVKMKNPSLDIECVMHFDMKALPLLVEWKNLFEGDYVIGIEPATTRFDEYKKNPIKPGEEHKFNVSVKFN